MTEAGRGHGGNLRALAARAGRPAATIIDFSANLNPLGPPPWLASVINAAVPSVVHYPDPDCAGLTRAVCRRYGVGAGEVVCAAGSTEILHLLPGLLRPVMAVSFAPAYSDYLAPCRAAGVPVVVLPLGEDQGWLPDLDRLADTLEESPGAQTGPVLAYLGQPNNPTGRTFDAADLRLLAARFPRVLFVVDEAFADFAPSLDRLAADRPANVLTLLSLTKIYAVPGLRLGLALAEPGLAARIRAGLPAWSVSTMAQAVGEAALADDAFLARTRTEVARLRASLESGLAALGERAGLVVFPGEANFLLARLTGDAPDATALAARLLDRGIAIRVCSNFEGLDRSFFRVAVRPDEENALLLREMGGILGVPSGPKPRPRPALRRPPALMLQGTSSNAGKSLLAAALCRILLQDGHDAAPFKAQNMSLNSGVTPAGEEMGRAQVLQAQACRLTPDVRMNPVLLKPNSDTGSQVIVMGRPVGSMGVAEYIRRKPEFFARARDAYDSLAAGREVMVLEGAGSPAEVNLKSHDIVNMAMARHAGASVLLVGDIDRGGVFASLLGTMECLEPWERAMVRGFVLNKFRGDPALLADGTAWLRRRTGVETVGVVPFIRELGLPEEDSVSFKEGGGEDGRPFDPGQGLLDIACIDLEHISNFTDLDPLRLEPDVRLRIVRRAEDLGRPDAVIVPGSKNTLADLAALRQGGLERALLDLAAGGGTEIVGICGGFQMLGERMDDPLGLEVSDEAGRSAPGLGLLAVATALEPRKTLRRARCRHLQTGLMVTGYEIHHGRTVPLRESEAKALLVPDDGEPAGYGAPGGLVWGSYLHGLFDADAFRRAWLDGLRRRRGLAPLGGVTARYDLEPALDRLADAVRGSLDMAAVYRMIGL